MSFPIYPEKYKLPALVTAAQMLAFRRGQGGLKGLQAPQGAVLCLYNGVIKHFPWKYPSRHIGAFQCDLYLLNKTAGRVGVLGNFGMGAPALVALAEQMAAWGTRRLVILSLTGGLQPALKPGDIVLADSAVRDEGTSYHYLPPAERVQASPALVASIGRALTARALAEGQEIRPQSPRRTSVLTVIAYIFAALFTLQLLFGLLALGLAAFSGFD